MTKMQNCVIRNDGRDHELALKLSLVGIKVVTPLKLLNILFILKHYQMCPLLPSNRKIESIQISPFSHNSLDAKQTVTNL